MRSTGKYSWKRELHKNSHCRQHQQGITYVQQASLPLPNICPSLSALLASTMAAQKPKSVDILQLEEEIFLHETVIESLNRKLGLISQQLVEENAKLSAHKTREAELNSRCSFLRSNLEDQTRCVCDESTRVNEMFISY